MLQCTGPENNCVSERKQDLILSLLWWKTFMGGSSSSVSVIVTSLEVQNVCPE